METAPIIIKSTGTITRSSGGPGALRSRSRPTNPWVWSEDWVGVLIVCTVFLEQCLFGANQVGLSLLFALIHALILVAALATAWGPPAMAALRGWSTAAVLFALMVGASLLGLTPLGPCGRAVWDAVGRPRIASIYPAGVLIELAKLVGLAALFTAGAIVASSRRRAENLFFCFIAAGAVFAFGCLLLEAISPLEVLGWLKPSIARGRVSGLFSSANTAGTAFGLILLLATAGLMGKAGRARAPGRWAQLEAVFSQAPVEIACLLLSAGCLLLSGSRGASGALFATLALFLIWQRLSAGRDIGASGAALGVLSIMGAVILIAGGLVMGRYTSVSIPDDWRFQWTEIYWRAFLVSPYVGYGLGSFHSVNGMMYNLANFQMLSWAGAAHNVFIQWLLQAGLIGAVPMFGCILWILSRILGASLKAKSTAVWLRGLVAISLFVCLHGLTDYALEEPSIAALWTLLLGAGLGLASRRV